MDFLILIIIYALILNKFNKKDIKELLILVSFMIGLVISYEFIGKSYITPYVLPLDTLELIQESSGTPAKNIAAIIPVLLFGSIYMTLSLPIINWIRTSKYISKEN